MKITGKWQRFLLAAFLLMGIMIWAVPAAAADSDKTYVVVLDPGHGGSDQGASAKYNGKTYYEADINWRIAVYVKRYLEENDKNIKVYLTRNGNEYISLESRVNQAEARNADLLVSLHINDSESASPKGASVLISRGTYRASIAQKERLFGKYVMEELKSIGITGRFPETGGMEYRMSENGSTYPNGQPRDYYYIVANSVEANLPGVIIEHAFISNPSDVSNFLSSSAKIKKVGDADGKAIIRYVDYMRAHPEQEVKDGWYLYKGSYYYYQDGKKIKNKLLSLSDGIYYVDSTGKRYSGWKTISGKRYYFKEDGKAAKGWMKLNGSYYYFNNKYAYMYRNAKLTSGSGNVYIFGADGKRASGWCEYDGKRYYVGSKGYAYRGMHTIGGRIYYFHSSKAYLYVKKVFTRKNGDVYYAGTKGFCYTNGFVSVTTNGVKNRYYFGKDGKALKGWQKIDGKWYYFDKKTGAAYRNRTIRNAAGREYIFNSRGECTNR